MPGPEAIMIIIIGAKVMRGAGRPLGRTAAAGLGLAGGPVMMESVGWRATGSGAVPSGQIMMQDPAGAKGEMTAGTP